MIFFDDIVHFIDEENIVTYVDFDCCNTFCPKAASKIWHINRERKNICGSYKTPICISIKDLNSCSIVEEHTLKNLFEVVHFMGNGSCSPYKTEAHWWWTFSVQSTSWKKQLSQLEQILPDVLFNATDGDERRIDCASALLFSKQKHLADGRVNEKVARLKSWVILQTRSNGWCSTVCDELWLYLGVAICSRCSFSVVCCWSVHVFFYEKSLSSFILFDDSV